MTLTPLPIEYSAVRGLDGTTPHPPRNEKELTQSLKDEYLGWGLAKKVAESFYFLLPIIAVGSLGSLAGGRRVVTLC